MGLEHESPSPLESRKPGFLTSLFGRGNQPRPDELQWDTDDYRPPADSVGSGPDGAVSAADGAAAPGHDEVPAAGSGAPTLIANVAGAPGAQRAGQGSVIEGQVVTGDEVASAGGPRNGQGVVDRWQLPAATLRAMREQVADFAEFAHRQRVPSLPDLLALGSGGGITAAAVRVVTEVIRAMFPGLAVDDAVLTEALLRALVAPGDPRPAGVEDTPSIVSLHGRLLLDVSRAAAGAGQAPTTRLVLPGDRTGSPNGSAESDGAGPDGSGTGQLAPCAVVIFGPAAAIAAGRPYLSLDDLTSYARQEAYRLGRTGDEPEAARTGMRAARGLEIVVLLDRSLGGGVWIDVDPDTGRLAAALSVELTNPAALLAGIRFRHLAAS